MKNTVKITKSELQNIIKEGVERLHKRKTLIENKINKQLNNLKKMNLMKNYLSLKRKIKIKN